MGEIDILNKEAIKTDLALIRTCLRLISQTITQCQRAGEDFSVSENEEIHNLVSKIDKDLNRIKVKINY